MIELALSAFVTLFVVLDPPGMGPIFAALTERETDATRRRLALRGTVTAGIILVAFAFVFAAAYAVSAFAAPPGGATRG